MKKLWNKKHLNFYLKKLDQINFWYREAILNENNNWWGGKPGCPGNLGPNKVGLDYKHEIDTHPINLAIKSINKFISNAFKIKGRQIILTMV